MNLSNNEQAIYDLFYLACKENDGFVNESHREIGIMIGCSASAVSAAVRSLVNKGFISVNSDRGKAGMEILILKEIAK